MTYHISGYPDFVDNNLIPFNSNQKQDNATIQGQFVLESDSCAAYQAPYDISITFPDFVSKSNRTNPEPPCCESCQEKDLHSHLQKTQARYENYHFEKNSLLDVFQHIDTQIMNEDGKQIYDAAIYPDEVPPTSLSKEKRRDSTLVNALDGLRVSKNGQKVLSNLNHYDLYNQPCPKTPLQLRYRKNQKPYPIGHFFTDPYLQTGAFYGRSVGSIDNTGNCTGWNIGGPYFMTAGHCESPNRKRRVVFGNYSRDWSESEYTQGAIDLWKRLEQLGIPKERIVSIEGGAVPINSNNLYSLLYDLPRLGKVDCFVEKTYLHNAWSKTNDPEETGKECYDLPDKLSTSDLSVFRCGSVRIEYTLTDNPIDREIESVEVWPSTLYGHIPIETERWKKSPPISTNHPLYLLAYNSPLDFEKYAGQTKHVFLSPGVYSHDNFPSKTSGEGRICSGALLDADEYYSLGGSSGGAILLPEDLTFDRSPFNDYISRNRAIAVNVQGKAPLGSGGLGSYLLHDISRFTPNRLPLPTDYLFNNNQNIFVTSLGEGHQEVNMSCPKHYAAAGIVASNLSSKIGNFGLVCMPYTNPFLYRWSFAKTGVVASGSRDVSIIPALGLILNPPSGLDYREVTEQNMVPLDVYMNEYLSTLSSLPREFLCGEWPNFVDHGYKRQSYQQDLVMCPPGFYLQSITFVTSNNDSRIQGISEITCRSWDGTRRITRKVNIGAVNGTSTSRVINCGLKSVISNIVAKRSNNFSGVSSFGCRKAR